MAEEGAGRRPFLNDIALAKSLAPARFFSLSNGDIPAQFGAKKLQIKII
jgi:hypothetical protein